MIDFPEPGSRATAWNATLIEVIDRAQKHSISEVTLHVDRGEAVVVVGSNGAGKTTLMKTIIGLLKPSYGSIHFQGEKISEQMVHRVVKKGISLIPEGRMVFGDQTTVIENLMLGAYWCYRSMGRKDIEYSLERCFTRFPILRAALSTGRDLKRG